MVLGLTRGIPFILVTLRRFSMGGQYSNKIREGFLPPEHMSRDILSSYKFPEDWPYTTSDFARVDESTDEIFYKLPRLVTHIDDGAIEGIQKLYAQVFLKNDDVLDLCSSWISHFPQQPRINNAVGLGMNEAELKANERLTSYVVKDLNLDPALPFSENSFDVVVNAVSVDYLIQPREIFREIHRVMRPGGLVVMSFSNRCFPSKVIARWLKTSDDEHVQMVGTYFATCGKEFENIRGYSLKTSSDPLYVVMANKKSDCDANL